MIRLNRLTDYAIVVMSEMSRSGGTTTAPHLAQESGIPLPTVSKLLKQLAHAHLVVSHRGAAGGYELSRPASAISVAEIITALEGPIALTACVSGAESACEVEGSCPMRGNWNKVNRAIRSALEQVSLAEMAMPGITCAAPPRRGELAAVTAALSSAS